MRGRPTRAAHDTVGRPMDQMTVVATIVNGATAYCSLPELARPIGRRLDLSNGRSSHCPADGLFTSRIEGACDLSWVARTERSSSSERTHTH